MIEHYLVVTLFLISNHSCGKHSQNDKIQNSMGLCLIEAAGKQPQSDEANKLSVLAKLNQPHLQAREHQASRMSLQGCGIRILFRVYKSQKMPGSRKTWLSLFISVSISPSLCLHLLNCFFVTSFIFLAPA